MLRRNGSQSVCCTQCGVKRALTLNLRNLISAVLSLFEFLLCDFLSLDQSRLLLMKLKSLFTKLINAY